VSLILLQVGQKLLDTEDINPMLPFPFGRMYFVATPPSDAIGFNGSFFNIISDDIYASGMKRIYQEAN